MLISHASEMMLKVFKLGFHSRGTEFGQMTSKRSFSSDSPLKRLYFFWPHSSLCRDRVVGWTEYWQNT